MIATNNYSIDFKGGSNGPKWEVVNDDVMGGRSVSQMRYTDNSMVFTGKVSLENNGGFASVRGPLQLIDLSKYTTVKIRFRSSGRDFALRLATSDQYYMPHYKYFFSSSTGEWETAEFPLRDFLEYVMGRPTGDLIDGEELEKIIRIGIILNDKKAGEFELEVDFIRFE